jgi:hypothetical protein
MLNDQCPVGNSQSRAIAGEHQRIDARISLLSPKLSALGIFVATALGFSVDQFRSLPVLSARAWMPT